MTDPRETNLPRWAQDILHKQRGRIAELDRMLLTATGENARDASGKISVGGLSMQDWVALHDWSMIRFKVSGGHVDVRLEGDRLDINCHPEQLMIFPMGGNCAQVKVGRRVP